MARTTPPATPPIAIPIYSATFFFSFTIPVICSYSFIFLDDIIQINAKFHLFKLKLLANGDVS